MFRLPVIRRLRRPIARFAAAREGNVAVLFAIALVPIIGVVGAAIDYSRAVKARTSMQAALDSTALMLSKDLNQGTISAGNINTTAQQYFDALFTDKTSLPTVTVSAVYTAATSSTAATVVLTANSSIQTQFIRVLSRMLSNANTYDSMALNTTSTTTWGNVKMRVALALDNTGSMAQDGKITALRNAVAGSGGLIDQLSALSKTNGDVYISVIPFAKVVNVGSSNYGQSWIDWTDWQNPPTQQPNNGSYQTQIPNSNFTLAQWANVGPSSSCPFKSSNGFPYFGCTSSPTNGSSNASSIPSNGTYKGYICPGWDSASHSYYNGCWDSVATGSTAALCTGSSCNCNGANSTCSCTGNNSSTVCTVSTYTHTWHANSTSTWTGCVADRTQPNDATGVLPATSDVTTLFPANQYNENSTSYCSSASTSSSRSFR